MTALLDIELMLSVLGFVACVVAVPSLGVVIGVRWAFGWRPR